MVKNFQPGLGDFIKVADKTHKMYGETGIVLNRELTGGKPKLDIVKTPKPTVITAKDNLMGRQFYVDSDRVTVVAKRDHVAGPKSFREHLNSTNHREIIPENWEPVVVFEDAPANNVGDGKIAGANEDPPGPPKFAGHRVFKVNGDTFHKCLKGKRKYARFKNYFNIDESPGCEIRDYAYKNPGRAILVQNETDGSMVYLKFARRKQ